MIIQERNCKGKKRVKWKFIFIVFPVLLLIFFFIAAGDAMSRRNGSKDGGT